MKKLLIGLLALGSISSFAQNIDKSSFCQGRGQEAIDNQKELIEIGVASGEISHDLEGFFMDGVEKMKENYNFICKGIRISNGPTLSLREKQLSLIVKGLESGDIDDELADYFLLNLNKM